MLVNSSPELPTKRAKKGVPELLASGPGFTEADVFPRSGEGRFLDGFREERALGALAGAVGSRARSCEALMLPPT